MSIRDGDSFPIEVILLIIEQSDPSMQTCWSFVSSDFTQYRQKTRNDFIRSTYGSNYHSILKHFNLTVDDIMYHNRSGWKAPTDNPRFWKSSELCPEATGYWCLSMGQVVPGETIVTEGVNAMAIGRNLQNSGDFSVVMGQNATNNIKLSMTHASGFNRSHTIRVHLAGIGLLKTYDGCFLKLGYKCKALVQARLISVEGESAIMNFVIEEGEINRIIRFDPNETQCCDDNKKYSPVMTSEGLSIKVDSKIWFNASLKLVTVN